MNAELLKRIAAALELARLDTLELGDALDGRVRVSQGELVIETRTTRDSGKMSHGGEYSYYSCFRPVDDGVYVYEDWSAEFNRLEWLGDGETLAGQASVDELMDGAQKLLTPSS